MELKRWTWLAAVAPALLLQACVAGEGVSFATRVGNSDPIETASADDAATSEDSAPANAGLIASSGNALLPGGLILAQGPGGLSDGSALPGLNGLTGVVGVQAGLELNQGQAPQLALNTTGALAGSPLNAPLGNITGAANGLLTGVTAAVPTVSIVSPAGQPLSGIGGGTTSVINTVSGAAPAPAPTVVNVVNGATTVAGGLVGTVASMTSSSTPAPTGLGGLTGLLPR